MEQNKLLEAFAGLRNFLPPNCFELVMPLIIQHKVHLTVARERQSKLGDYRNAWGGKNHRISINGNLNPYAFLITLLHELAHLLAFEQHGNRIAPHGREWKNLYGQVLAAFLAKGVFPADIAAELESNLHNPGASTCSEEGLQRILTRYNKGAAELTMVELIEEGRHFMLQNGRVFKRGKKLRKRIACQELPQMRTFLFSPIFEVKPVEM
ncbi:MAG: hypothetical protein EAY75_02545 [Bacteroidetes bacterium]|nr:MAG: hypothetical protein EAY75_02545 [Bacteroidota bacterium]